MKSLTAQYLHSVLAYDMLTGIFTWKCWRGRRSKAGTIAGNLNDRGYIKIGAFGKTHYAHRLAWLYVYGTLPASEIDHINRNKQDNRIANLRLATRSQNCQNKRHQNRISGVQARPNGTWVARIQTDGERRFLGTFTTADAAKSAYAAAKRDMHPFSEFANCQP